MGKQQLSAIQKRSQRGNVLLANIARFQAHRPSQLRRSNRRFLGSIINMIREILNIVRVKSFALIPRQKHVNQCIHELSIQALELEIKLIELEAKLALKK